jgi:hypothetical protein
MPRSASANGGGKPDYRPIVESALDVASLVGDEFVNRKTITKAIIQAWGGPKMFAKEFRREFKAAKAGSAVRVRFMTAILSAVLQFGEEDEGSFDPEDLEAELIRINTRLEGKRADAYARAQQKRAGEEVREPVHEGLEDGIPAETEVGGVFPPVAEEG